ncbi:MAG: RdgB/HAM1 family non-canonical purine NTP pyrophosphatase [Acidobacteriota bacterium]
MSPQTRKLLIATHNRGKVAELTRMLSGIACDLLSLSDVPDVKEVAETGTTFAENAAIKASGYASQSRHLSLADDSGLEVEALDGRPGIYSARYGGEGTSFAEKMASLLSELSETGGQNRRARFVCAMALASDTSEILFRSEGICEGTIAPDPRGSGGFGYDPLFIPDGFNKTFGELDEAIKQKISHRAGAFCQIIPFLRHFIAI